MAEEVKIVIDVEGGKGAQTVKEVSKDLEKAAKSGDKMSESIKKSGGVTLDVRQKLRDLQNQMAEIGDVGSAEFQQLAAEAGKYKDQMNNANAAIKAMSADFPKLQVGVQALQAMGAAAQTAMSVQALLGTENEEVTKTIQKMIAVQGVMNGLQSVANLLSDESAIGLKIRTIRTNLFTRATVAQAVATGEATVAQKIMNAVMKANPIGLIITGITALIALFVVLGNSVQSIGKFFSDLGRDIMILFGPILEFFGILDEGATNALKNEKALEEQRKADAKAISARNTKRLAEIEAERKALEKAHKDAEEDLNFQIEINNLLGKSSRALTEEKLQNNIDFAREQERLIAEQIASWTKYYEDLFVFSGKSREDFKAQMRGQGIDLDILLQEATDLQEKANQRVQLSDAKLIEFRLKGSKKVKEEKKKDEKETVDNTLKEQQRLLDRRIKAQKELDKLEISNIKDAEERKRAELMFAFEESIAQLDSNIEEENALILAREQELQDALTQLSKDSQDERDREKKEKREAQVQSAIDSAENLVKIAESVNTIFHGKELKRIEEKQKRGEQLTKSEIRRLQKEEKIQKAFALAQVAIDTARGISAAVAAGAGLVFPANLAAIISGVSAVLAGVAQASQILGSGSTIDTGGGSDAATIEDAAGGATEAAPLSTVQEGSTLLNQQPQQVVVVEAITEGIKNVGVIEAQATFG